MTTTVHFDDLASLVGHPARRDRVDDHQPGPDQHLRRRDG
jgi:hypothetical protein